MTSIQIIVLVIVAASFALALYYAATASKGKAFDAKVEALKDKARLRGATTASASAATAYIVADEAFNSMPTDDTDPFQSFLRSDTDFWNSWT